MLHIYAAMAEAEGIAISTRTKAALAAAKARGVKLGNPRLLAGSPDQGRMAAASKSAKATARATDLLPVIAEIRAAGVPTLTGIAKAMNGARRADTERPRRLESGDGDVAGSPNARLNTRAAWQIAVALGGDLLPESAGGQHLIPTALTVDSRRGRESPVFSMR
jgi:hypothetical protein